MTYNHRDLVDLLQRYLFLKNKKQNWIKARVPVHLDVYFSATDSFYYFYCREQSIEFVAMGKS